MGTWRNWQTRTLQERVDYIHGGSTPLVPTRQQLSLTQSAIRHILPSSSLNRSVRRESERQHNRRNLDVLQTFFFVSYVLLYDCFVYP